MRPVFLLRAIVFSLVTSLLFSGFASSQTNAPPEGITVTGQGQASAPPDSTTFQISLSTGMFPTEPGWQPFGTPAAGGAGPVQALIDALMEAGVSEADISIVLPPYIGNGAYGPFGPIAAFIEVTITDPDAERVRQVIDAANTGAGASMMMLGDISVIHTVEDCSALQQEAMTNAFANAQERAARQADILGVSLGEVTASRDSIYAVTTYDPILGLAQDGSCSYSGAALPSYGPSGPTPYDLASEPEVIVYASLDVTFAIDSASSATPGS